MKSIIEKIWYQPSLWQWILLPVHLLLYLLVIARRCFYISGIKKSQKPPCKVIIVGNITAGGTGKTPFIIWLVNFLQQQNKKVVVISRGYGGQSERYPLIVDASVEAGEAGDEPKLLTERLKCPVIVDPNRVRAALFAHSQFQPDFIVSDDGLQHYPLARDIEICIIDGYRLLGNRMLLPVGPLREPVSRLKSCDLVIQNGGTVRFSHYFDVRASQLINLKTGECYQLEQDNLPVTQCHAVCGIGNPEKFKATLQHLRIAFDLHVFADHHHFQAQDFQSFDDKPVIMTEKDAVKCRAFAKENWWYVTIDVVPNNDTIDKIQQWI